VFRLRLGTSAGVGCAARISALKQQHSRFRRCRKCFSHRIVVFFSMRHEMICMTMAADRSLIARHA
jgi:hypothetical protein